MTQLDPKLAEELRKLFDSPPPAAPEHAEAMKRAFEHFRSMHALDNRTPREMFYHGFYMGWLWRGIHDAS